jgi:hypothetical protein
MWAITAYLNPMGYQARRDNFRRFRERLKVPLVAVELGFRDKYDLAAADADILVQIKGGDVLWQKERLLNLAVRALPADCSKVAWVDCDIIFDQPGWAEKVEAALDRVALAQLFRFVHQLPRGAIPETVAREELPTRQSVLYAVASGLPIEACVNEKPVDGLYTMSRGFAWAAWRGLLDRHGLYDACIIGGGDRAMVYAIFGRYEEAISHFYMNEEEQRRYLDWAVPFSEAIGGAFEHVDNDIFHLWHGDMRRRGAASRQAGLRSFEFNPDRDIAVADSGAWRWNSNKPAMHEFMQSYFASRREDG